MSKLDTLKGGCILNQLIIYTESNWNDARKALNMIDSGFIMTVRLPQEHNCEQKAAPAYCSPIILKNISLEETKEALETVKGQFDITMQMQPILSSIKKVWR